MSLKIFNNSKTFTNGGMENFVLDFSGQENYNYFIMNCAEKETEEL